MSLHLQSQSVTQLLDDTGITYTGSDGPTGPDIYNYNLEPCSSYRVSLDFEFSLPWEGSGNMEFCTETNLDGSQTCLGCNCDPTTPMFSGCNTCWDFLWVRVIVDGAVTAEELIGDAGTTNADQMGTITFPILCANNARDLSINIVTQTWADDESITFRNIQVECWEGVPEINTDDPICADEVLNLMGSAIDESVVTGWAWSSDGAGIIANPAAQNTTATNASNGETYLLTTTDDNNCTSMEEVVVVVDPIITPTFDPIGPLCNTDPVFTFPSSSTNTPPIIGTWAPASIDPATDASPVNAIFTPSAEQCADDLPLAVIIEDCTCTLTSAGLSLLDCDPNGTLSDPTDDIIIFTLNPMGDFLSSTYNVSVNQGTITPTTGNYGVATGFQLQTGSAGNGPVQLTITDASGAPCQLTITIADDGPCSPECLINDAGLADVQCDPNFTDNIDTDDRITFLLNPMGNGLSGTYSVTVNTGTITPNTGNYGGNTLFTLQEGSAGSGTDVIVTITDDNNPGCEIMVTILDPGNCSDGCIIFSAGIIVQPYCNANNTNTDPSDDFIEFVLQPTGTGNFFNVIVDYGTITPNDGIFGVANFFSLQNGSAGAGNVTLTIIDVDDPTCTFTITLMDPGSCSDDCLITNTGLIIDPCNDNGTSTDALDDFISLDLNPTGTGLGTMYTVTVNSGTITPTTASYGAITSFQLQNGSAGAGNVTVTITDIDNNSCPIDVEIIDPGSCSGDCIIVNSGLTIDPCNNNGTDTDPADDFITLNLNPTGEGLGTMYTVTVSSGTITPSIGTYGTPTQYQLQNGSAGAGNVTVTITDIDNNSCPIDVEIIDPGSCSGDCVIVDSALTIDPCNDNDTDTDPSDDFISFNLNPAGTGLGTMYTVMVSSGTIMPTSASYGAVTSFQLQNGSAGAGNVTLTINDADANCPINLNILDPGPCSDECTFADLGLMIDPCDNNGTDTDPTDDFITFDLNPTGIGIGSTYTIMVSSGTITPTSAPYGAPTSFQLQNGSAGAGNVMVTITDNDNNVCFAVVQIIDPGSCSGVCTLASGNPTTQCEGNGTSDPTDDYITFELNPTGSNLGTMYTVTVSSGTITPTAATYGVTTPFRLQDGSAGAGNVIVTLDDTDSSCPIFINITDPGVCSDPCTLDNLVLPVSQCDDNGTPNPADDFYTFTINLSGNNTGANFILSGALAGTYAYGTTHSFGPILVSDGNLFLTFTDELNAGCTSNITLMPPDCNCSIIDPPIGNDISICADMSVPDLNVTASPGLEVNWYDAPTGGNLLAGNSLTYSANTSGTYYAEAIEPISMCTSNRTAINLTINPIPTFTEMTNCDIGSATYHIDIVSDVDSIQSTVGVVNNTAGLSITQIPENMMATVTLINRLTLCEIQFTIDPPNCNCPVINVPMVMDQLVCSGEPILEFTATVDPGLSANWYDTPTGGNLLLASSITFTPDMPGTYYVEAVDIVLNCNSARVPVQLIVLPNPSYNFISSTCTTNNDGYEVTFTSDADAVTFNSNAINPDVNGNYSFINNDITANSIVNLFYNTGPCDTTIILMPPSCCPAETPAISITEPDTIHCNQPSVILDGSGSQIGADIIFQWLDQNFMPILGANTPNYSASDAGIYYLRSTDVSAACINIDSVIVVESALDSFDLVSVLMDCDQDGAMLMINQVYGGSEPYLYQLDDNAFTTMSIFDNVSSGQHTITIQDNNNCTISDTVTINSDMSFALDLGPDVFINLGDSIQLMARASVPNLMYIWDQSPSLSCTSCPDPWARPIETELFTIIAIDENGCEQSASIRVILNHNVEVFIPNIFTPNGDGTNDRFTIYGSDQIAQINYMRIFNRWGDMVFVEKNIPINNGLTGWNGRYKGSRAESGVYLFTMELLLTDGSRQMYHGDITLIK